MTTYEIARGKTKIILVHEPGAEPTIVTIKSLDDITAGDGKRHDILEGKGKLANITTCNVFRLLKRQGIPTHYLAGLTGDTFTAQRCRMVKLECVARRLAAGSYLERNPEVAKGTRFDKLVIEWFDKDDANHDPYVAFDLLHGEMVRYDAHKPIRPENIIDRLPIVETHMSEFPAFLTIDDLEDVLGMMTDYLRLSFVALEDAWAERGVTLVDFKIEFGYTWDGRLVVADVVDNDSWRIWVDGDPKLQMDKQAYRDLPDDCTPKDKQIALTQILANYQWVADQTSTFLPAS